MEKDIKMLARKTNLLFIMAGMIMLFSFVGCQSQDSKISDDPIEISIQNNLLVVERRQVYLDWDFSITADLPGYNYIYADSDSRNMSKSISSVINQELHSLLDDLCRERSEKEKADYYYKAMSSPDEPISDLDGIRDEYQSLIEDAGGQWIFFALIAQTDSFVTYGLEHYHCGGSCGSEFNCYTFSKKDGRRINKLITWEDIKRFIKDHPNANHPFGQWQLEADNDDMVNIYDAGLLNDGLLLVNEDQVNHYVVGKVAYEDILPYLSREAQKLVGTMGKSMERERWYLGRCIGKVEKKENVIIRLMQREPLWQSFNDFNYTDEKAFVEDKVFSLTAYEEAGSIYKPIKIFDQKVGNGPFARLEFSFPETSREGLSFDDEYFTLDEKVLYVPDIKEDGKVDIAPLKYDGSHFVPVSPEATKPQGAIVGKLVSDSKDSICLTRILDESGPVLEGVSAYYVRNGLYVPARIFPYYETKMSYLLGDEPFVSSHPNGRGYAFDPDERKVYEIISERTSMGGFGCFDRYVVYGFNGKNFYFDKEDGGFWLHPSIRKFGRLFYLGKSKDYLLRIDEMRSYDWREMDEDDYEAAKTDTCRYRYAAWKNKDNMLEAPNVVIENGYLNDKKGCYVFENNGYTYDVYENQLEVYHGNKKVLEQQLRVIASVDNN